MAVGVKAYQRALWERRRYRGAWLPDVRFELDDVGVIGQNETFSRLTTLGNLGVDFEVRKSDGSSEYKLIEANDYNVQAGFSATAPAPVTPVGHAKAGVTYWFKSNNAVLSHLWGCSHEEIDNQTAIEQQIRDLREQQRWEPGYVVVTKLVRARGQTVAITGKGEAAVEFSLSASVDPLAINLADVGLKCRTGRHRGNVETYVAESAVTPMFQLSGFQRRWLGLKTETWSPNAEMARLETPAGKKEIPVEVEVFDELEPNFEDNDELED